MNIIVTGGAGFIGSALIIELIGNTEHQVLNFDKLTYAANLAALTAVENSPRYRFFRGDICNRQDVEKAFAGFKPDALMHLAAESHVDRSISGPADFIHTNIVGTFNLLETAARYASNNRQFIFHHISTDEVYGDLGHTTGLFSEDSPYRPSSPYSASKASADHLVRAWQRTYALPTLISNCSNNYGPFQHPEKLIPLTITNALAHKPIPVYGSGQQIRDWLYVEDHARALVKIVSAGTPGQTYNIGGRSEKQNIEVVRAICAILDELAPRKGRHSGAGGNLNEGSSYSDLITFVADRPGHDQRYAIDSAKIERELGWKPLLTFEAGLRQTIEWFLKS